MVETPSINFVVGKNSEPKIEKTVEIESETFDSYAKDVQENEPKKFLLKQEKKARDLYLIFY